MDMEFGCSCDSPPEEYNINTTATNEHVPDIECKNRIIMERVRALVRTFLFKKIPGRIIIELIQFVGPGPIKNHWKMEYQMCILQEI